MHVRAKQKSSTKWCHICHELAVGLVTEVVDDETLLDRDFAVELRLSLSAICHRVNVSSRVWLHIVSLSRSLSRLQQRDKLRESGDSYHKPTASAQETNKQIPIVIYESTTIYRHSGDVAGHRFALTGSLSRHHFSPWLRPPFEGFSKRLVLRRRAKGAGHFALGWVCLCSSHFCIMGFLGSSLGFDFGFVLQNVEDLVWT